MYMSISYLGLIALLICYFSTFFFKDERSITLILIGLVFMLISLFYEIGGKLTFLFVGLISPLVLNIDLKIKREIKKGRDKNLLKNFLIYCLFVGILVVTEIRDFKDTFENSSELRMVEIMFLMTSVYFLIKLMVKKENE